jgi:hypothetical protein
MLHKAVFSVPADTPREKVLEKGPDFAKIFLEARERDGWRLTSRVLLDPYPKLTDEPDRVKYVIWAEFDRRPIKRKFEIPENKKLIERLVKKYGAKLS